MYTIAAITALIAGVSAAPTSFVERAGYVSYNGDGSVGAGWPGSDKWAEFDTIWNGYESMISKSCDWMKVPNNTPQESADLKSAIQSVSAANKVDARFVLATVLQESKGCVRIWKTGNGVTNPGVMQDHNGSHFCNDGVNVVGNLKNPCPSSEISGMIQDGAVGTADGDGLSKILAGKTDAQSVYHASRIYNSGSVAANGDLSNANGATASYASDIANRMMGVVFDTTAFVAGAAAPAPASNGGGSTTSAPAKTAGGSYTVKSGDSCWTIATANGLTVAALEAKNPALGSACALQPGQTLVI